MQGLAKTLEQERYALDLTHAQYGHHNETLTPWKTYLETRATYTSDLLPLRRDRTKAETTIFDMFGDKGGLLQATTGLFEKAMTAAVRDVPGWTALWKPPDDITYKQRVKKILEHITACLDQFVDTTLNGKEYRLWHSAQHKRIMESNPSRIREKKLVSWGADLCAALLLHLP
ncbi:MAG: hypothetical protein Q9183_004531 [Haloplaca sp. 2 TL-2023]